MTKTLHISNDLENLIKKITIVDSGNGYIKFGDGTMVCYGSSTTQNCSPGATVFGISLPQTFINNSYTVSLSRSDGGANYASTLERILSKGNYYFEIYVWNDNQNVANSLQFDYIAIGKWK